MKNIKILLALFCMFLATNKVVAQDWVYKKAQKSTEEFNNKLLSLNDSAALSEEQKEKISLLFVEKFEKTKEIKALGLAKEDEKQQLADLYKSDWKKTHDLLTPVQRLAWQKAKKY